MALAEKDITKKSNKGYDSASETGVDNLDVSDSVITENKDLKEINGMLGKVEEGELVDEAMQKKQQQYAEAEINSENIYTYTVGDEPDSFEEDEEETLLNKAIEDAENLLKSQEELLENTPNFPEQTQNDEIALEGLDDFPEVDEIDLSAEDSFAGNQSESENVNDEVDNNNILSSLEESSEINGFEGKLDNISGSKDDLTEENRLDDNTDSFVSNEEVFEEQNGLEETFDSLPHIDEGEGLTNNFEENVDIGNDLEENAENSEELDDPLDLDDDTIPEDMMLAGFGEKPDTNIANDAFAEDNINENIEDSLNIEDVGENIEDSLNVEDAGENIEDSFNIEDTSESIEDGIVKEKVELGSDLEAIDKQEVVSDLTNNKDDKSEGSATVAENQNPTSGADDPNHVMTPDEIAALLAASDDDAADATPPADDIPVEDILSEGSSSVDELPIEDINEKSDEPIGMTTLNESDSEDIDSIMNSLSDENMTDNTDAAQSTDEAMLDGLSEENIDSSGGDSTEISSSEELTDELDDIELEKSQAEDKKGKKVKEKKAKKPKKEKKEGEGGEKKGFFSKLLAALFEDDEEDEEGNVQNNELASLTQENQEVLNELEGGKKKKKEKKEKKPKEKKEKKPKEKKEKKPKEPKPKKEKKPKPPKPPVPPEKPMARKKYIMAFLIVIPIGIMAIIPGLVMPERNAKSRGIAEYHNGNYREAYEDLYSLYKADKLSESEVLIYRKARAVSKMDYYYRTYEVFAAKNLDVEALNQLLKGVEAYPEVYQIVEETNDSEVAKQINTTYGNIQSTLMNKYGVSLEKANELLNLEKKKDYSKQLHRICGK